MTFKKDYINYLLYTVVTSRENGFSENYRLRKLVDSIMAIDDVMKVTYLVGKTAGLETLFKYMLYVSDKIDKSQVTIFTLKDNFDYDVKNLSKICEKISKYKSESVQEALENISEELEELPDEKEEGILSDDYTDNLSLEEDLADVTEESEETEESDESEDSKLTLIENTGRDSDAEVFELESISDSLENTETIENNDKAPVQETEPAIDEEEKPDEDIDIIEQKENETFAETDFESEENEAAETTKDKETAETTDIETAGPEIEEITAELLPELELEVHKPSSVQDEKHVKEETITNEAYYKFETKFFEEVKILEKLFVAVDKDCKTDSDGKLSEKCLQSLTEIIEITSELSNLSRQLSFDLIADIFLTMNLYFTKAISRHEIMTSERIKIFDSALALVNSLIKGEDYLNYDTVVDKIEKLKSEISGEKEEKFSEEAIEALPEQPEEIAFNEGALEEPQVIIPQGNIKQSQMDSAVFKLKYLVKEFEKSFTSIGNLMGEYSKFDALEKINELNNSLRIIAKISAIVKLNEVLKLAEVTYVFLKYVKDYRMDLMEPEIKQIVKYIIFTFKMLLTNRKPEDFNVLVQHLNNPVKIFADS